MAYSPRRPWWIWNVLALAALGISGCGKGEPENAAATKPTFVPEAYVWKVVKEGPLIPTAKGADPGRGPTLSVGTRLGMLTTTTYGTTEFPPREGLVEVETQEGVRGWFPEDSLWVATHRMKTQQPYWKDELPETFSPRPPDGELKAGTLIMQTAIGPGHEWLGGNLEDMTMVWVDHDGAEKYQ